MSYKAKSGKGAPLVFDLEIRREGRLDVRSPSPEAWFGETVSGPSRPHLVDTTMLFAPRSGGVKRYLLAKRAWFADHRRGARHTRGWPGAGTRPPERGVATIASLRLPFGDGYRCPTSPKKWADHLIALRPDVIEAG